MHKTDFYKLSYNLKEQMCMNEHKQAIMPRHVSKPTPIQLSHILKRDLLRCRRSIKNNGYFNIDPGNN